MRSETVLTGRKASAPREIAGLQHGVIRLDQLLAAGLASSDVSKHAARGLLHRRYRGVYTVGHAALSTEGECLAAVFACGAGAVLSHLSTAHLRGIRRVPPPLFDVTVARYRRAPPGIRVHRVRRLDERDVTTFAGVPVTTVHRTLVDLTDMLTPHEIVNVIHEAAYHGWFVEAAVRDTMERANGRHNLGVLEQALALYRDGSAGTRSQAEVAFLALGLPEPLVNTKLLGIEVDFHWPEHRLVVELDGPGHGRPTTRRDDAARDAALNAAGYTLLRFATEEPLETIAAAVSDAMRSGPRRVPEDPASSTGSPPRAR